MKEQIYFVTKNRERLTSEIYSLSDFPEVRYETTKIYEFYLKGILGGHHLSRPERKLQKRFVVFCEGDTEYNYIDKMRGAKRQVPIPILRFTKYLLILETESIAKVRKACRQI